MVPVHAEKMYYKIGEVAEVAGLRTSVLRFWETEFNFLKPVKSKSGQRLYSSSDVDLVLQVKHLLYNEKYTIEGVKKKLSSKRKQTAEQMSEPAVGIDYSGVLCTIKNDLKLLRDYL